MTHESKRLAELLSTLQCTMADFFCIATCANRSESNLFVAVAWKKKPAVLHHLLAILANNFD